MILLVHTNRATQELQPFNDSANSALYDSEYVAEIIASIQTWMDPRTGQRLSLPATT